MFDLNKGETLEKYLEKGEPEEVARVEVAFSRTSCSKEFEEAIRKADGVTLVVFTELFCPDSAALLPYLRRIGEINNQMRIIFYPVKGNEVLLKNVTGAGKIPTLMVLDKTGLPSGFYVEHPQIFKEHMAAVNGEARRNLLRDFREGKMGDLIEKDLVRLLKG